MRTLDRRRYPAARSVPIEVAEAWRDEALAARRELEETRGALESTSAALHEALEARAERVQPREPEPAPEDGRVARLAADLANVRRHRDEAIGAARRGEKVEGLRALAEVYDDLQRSLDANPDHQSPWYAGHASILGKVRALLRQGGATAIGAEGEPFDPRVHEAVGTVAGPADRVVRVDQPGFQLDDGTLVRPARVRVGDGSRGESA